MDKLSENGLIAAEDLYYLLGENKRIRILDATYAVPGGHMSPEQAFLTRRIDGAQFFDIDVVADQEAPLPHTLPSPEYFADCVSAMGISNDDQVVVYDQSGAYMASSRAWWMFRVFGHENVCVLEGGLQSWMQKGFKLANGPAEIPAAGRFASSLRNDLVVSKTDLLNNLETKGMTVLDARPAARFHGMMPEPRPGMRAGRIPGSVNIPFPALLEQGTGQFKSEAILAELFDTQGLSRDDKLAVSCGSGVTACTVALGLFAARGQDSAIYDGSWSEWGADDAATPIEVSA